MLVTSYPPLGQEPGCGSSWVSGCGSIIGCNQVSPGAAVSSAGMGRVCLQDSVDGLRDSVSHELLARSCPGFLARRAPPSGRGSWLHQRIN